MIQQQLIELIAEAGSVEAMLFAMATIEFTEHREEIQAVLRQAAAEIEQIVP